MFKLVWLVDDRLEVTATAKGRAMGMILPAGTVRWVCRRLADIVTPAADAAHQSLRGGRGGR
ncbi:MAG TPA: hypothetical protein VN692_05210 [Steroidobacteraceae bacterium]|nr:hypothetical protein [Steroidobacteraceae bacterium]